MKGKGNWLRLLVAGAAFVLVGWAAGLVVLAWALLGFARSWFLTSLALRPIHRCSRGHAVEAYGVFRCGRCGAATESSAWFCEHCGAEAGYVSCAECGLAVANPRVRR